MLVCEVKTFWVVLCYSSFVKSSYGFSVAYWATYPASSKDMKHGMRPALDVAVRRILEANPVLAKNFIFIHDTYSEFSVTAECSEFDISESVLPFYEEYFIHPDKFPSDFSGPLGFAMSSSTSCHQEMYSYTATLFREANIFAMIMGTDSSLSNKTIYPTVINQNTSPYSAYIGALYALAVKYKWTRITYVCESLPSADCSNEDAYPFPVGLCDDTIIDDILEDIGPASGMTWTMTRLLTPDPMASPGPDFSPILEDRLIDQSRAILLLLLPRNLKYFMIQASKKGKTNGDHLFFTPQHVHTDGQPETEWTSDELNNTAVMDALQTLLVISEIGIDFSSAAVQDFLAEVDEISIKQYNLTGRPNETNNPSTIHYMDSFFLVTQALNRTWDEVAHLEPKSFIRRIVNQTYNVLSGDVYLGPNGRTILPVPVLRFNTSSQRWQKAFQCHPTTFEIWTNSTLNFQWFGEYDLPSEIPQCGLQNENCPWKNHTENKYVPVMVIACILLASYATMSYMRRRHIVRCYWHLYLDNWCVVHITTADQQEPPNVNSVTDEKKSEPEELDAVFEDTPAKAKLIFSVTGSPKQFVKQARDNMPFLQTALAVHDAKHKNLALFYGITLRRTAREVYLVGEHCEKGGIRQLLHSNTLLTDVQFRLAFIRDITEGLYFIHKSAVYFHGDLSIFTCQVDSRYSVKITQTGYSQILNTLIRRKTKEKTADRQSIDVKNYGGIVDILIRQTTAEETNRNSLAFPEILTKLEFAVIACQQDSDWQRPKASDLLQLIRSLSRSRESLIERMMKKVTRHADNLQQVVADRTVALVQETAKVDALLREMLPQSVITKLRNQELIHAELYDSATVLFSDIPIFGSLVEHCTPMVIVEFLNAVYTTFDGALEVFDAYKVETINDSYLVTSGIPIRNGSKHTTEICAVAMTLRQIGQSIKIASGPEIRVHLRIGINTGPVATGVVGTRMPRYCLFGDAMNTASRMESHGEPDRIHVGASTVAIVEADYPGDFVFEARGLVEIKGKGKIPTFWLTSAGSGAPQYDPLKFEKLILLTEAGLHA